jgi:hypothetical protein
MCCVYDGLEPYNYQSGCAVIWIPPYAVQPGVTLAFEQSHSPSVSVVLFLPTPCASLFAADLIYALLHYFPAFLGARQPLLRFPYPHETACPIRQSITVAP